MDDTRVERTGGDSSRRRAGSSGFRPPAESAGPPSGSEVRCRIVDGSTGGPLSARLRLTDARGHDVVPLGHPSELAPDAQQGDVRFQSKRFAYVDGDFALDPKSLPLRYQVIKGYEYVIAEGEIVAG